MELPYTGELPPGTARCKVCREPIQADARKCIHCQSDQGWRSRLTISVTMMSLLVALASVLTAATPAFVVMITPKNAKLLFAVQSSSEDNVFLLVSNHGIRPGSVRVAQLTYAQEGSDGRLTRLLLIDGLAPFEPKLIPAGDSELIKFKGFPPRSNGQGSVSDCRIEVDSADFQGTEVRSEFGTNCAFLQLFLSGH